MMCKTCGWISKCTSCDAFMTYHRTNNSQCHHCGKTDSSKKHLINALKTVNIYFWEQEQKELKNLEISSDE